VAYDVELSFAVFTILLHKGRCFRQASLDVVLLTNTIVPRCVGAKCRCKRRCKWAKGEDVLSTLATVVPA